jgi:hypothetical protein
VIQRDLACRPFDAEDWQSVSTSIVSSTRVYTRRVVGTHHIYLHKPLSE